MNDATPTGATAHDGRLWFPLGIHLLNLKFVRRIVSTTLSPPRSGEVTDVLCFEGLELMSEWRFAGMDKTYMHPKVALWLTRATREDALAEMTRSRSLYPFADAFEDDRASKFSQRWDTLVQFDRFEEATPLMTVSPHAEPAMFDRMLSMPLEHCRLSAGLKLGVLLHRNEVGRGENAVRELGVLPAIKEPPWGGAYNTFTAGELEHLSLVYEPHSEDTDDDDQWDD